MLQWVHALALTGETLQEANSLVFSVCNPNLGARHEGYWVDAGDDRNMNMSMH